METILELRGVDAGYDRHLVLRGVHFTLREGDFVGVIGPNGGGKTTLLKVILGLLPPRAGEVIYRFPARSLFGYLPQNSRFDARFPISVEEVVLSGLLSEKGIYKRYTRADRARAREMLEAYGMASCRDRAIGELSGGQVQRVFLCRALVSSPRVLILDEPATYVDNRFEQAFYSLLGELNRRMSIVMVSHDLATVRALAKSVISVSEGQCKKE
ncbi:MAG: metal ABC transporter ATP-binding protein [Odoribacteraceae bacterium]|jgi:zinc transport system ATP-binding protein|nr:metal ABC transporter ATP-binding protein [Odoribacteraceae bacterium]